ncbi:GNAT family N-acetyltransferase [Noviherbaspirillum sp.]|uniref:GNAT family N-acetyltransferase n=1 Tax=Noviherbaspirillum sp. TaxID=1926288 RepID=UPI002FE0FDDE
MMGRTTRQATHHREHGGFALVPGQRGGRLEQYLARFASLSAFVLRNLWCGRRIRPFPTFLYGGARVGPLSRDDIRHVERLYASLNGGSPLDLRKKAALWLHAPRLGIGVRDAATGELTGMSLYYFNARDRKEGTVHEGYIGLHASLRGAGLGTVVRRHALRQFAFAGLRGVSSRISLANTASLNGNLKLGFVPVETYFDSSMGEQRHYLVCDLQPYRPYRLCAGDEQERMKS